MKKNKKVSIFKRIGLIAIVFCLAIGSFFASVQKYGYNHNNFASANSIITNSIFSSSYISFSRVGHSTTEIDYNTTYNDFLSATHFNEGPYWVQNYRFDIRSNLDSSTSPDIEFFIMGGIYNSPNSNRYFGIFNTSNANDTSSHIVNVADYNLEGNRGSTLFETRYNNIAIGYTDLPDTWGYTMFMTALYIPDNDLLPSLNIVSIELGNGSGSDVYINFGGFEDLEIPSGFDNSNIICFTDTHGYKYYYFIPCWYSASVQPLSYYEYRKYYTPSFANLSENDSYNFGYSEGLTANQSTVYNNGYRAGKIDGEAIGFDKGVLQSNDYSFTSLFGAVIDAPIKAFSGLFNFEILGINLLDFFLGLLTFGVIIFVIKLLLGG